MKLKAFLMLLMALTAISLVGCNSSGNAAEAVATIRPTTEATARPTTEATALPTTEATAVPTTTAPSGDKTYTSEAGEFSLTYPTADILYENKVPSANGALTDEADTVSIQDKSNNGYVLSIAYFPLTGHDTLADFIDSHSACSELASTGGTDTTLAGTPAKLYTDTKCGSSKDTYLYAIQGSMGYRFIIETAANYAAVKTAVQSILDSFHSTSVAKGLTQDYYVEAADLSLRIPAEWKAGEAKDTDYGQSIQLGPTAATAAAGTPGMIVVADSKQTTVEQLAEKLCGGNCDTVNLQDVTIGKNISAQFATIGKKDASPLPWYFISHNNKLIGLTMYDANTQQSLEAIVQSLAFGHKVAATNEEEIAAVEAARFALAKELSVNPYQLATADVQKMSWPDGCLGVHKMGVLCTQIVSDGYVITFAANGRYYQTNTNADGSSLVQVPDAVAAPGGVALTTRDGNTCTAMILRHDLGADVGPCDGDLTHHDFSKDTPSAVQDLKNFAEEYGPFHVQSPLGTINFNGFGDTMADAFTQRRIGEMVQWIADAAITGHTDPTSQLVISWHREGGIAGFCDDLSIYSYGEAIGKSCQWDPNTAAGEQWFQLEKLSQLYDWMDQFASFDYTQSDPASVVDGMTVTVHFNGSGSTEATDADKSVITAFADELFAQYTADAPIPANCTVTALADDVLVYERPSAESAQFGTLTEDQSVQAMMRTDDGWLGFDPGVAQAANVGIFRMRWVAPDAAIEQAGECGGLPVATQISPTACYFMAMTDTAVYPTPDDNGTAQVTIPYGGYTAVTGQTSSGWYQLDLQDGSLSQSGTAWLNTADANFNGACDALPTVTP